MLRASNLFKEITKHTGLFNIQAIDNVPSIIKNGLLSNENASKIKHVSIAMKEVQERRDNIIIPNGMALHKYANAYFDFRNPMLYKLKDLNEDICILKFDCSILDIDGAIVSDRNASSNYACFDTPMIGLKEIDFDMVFSNDWTDDIPYEYYRKKSIKCAEVLVPHCIPYNFVVAACVYSDNAKTRLIKTGFDKTVYVKPELFF